MKSNSQVAMSLIEALVSLWISQSQFVWPALRCFDFSLLALVGWSRLVAGFPSFFTAKKNSSVRLADRQITN